MLEPVKDRLRKHLLLVAVWRGVKRALGGAKKERLYGLDLRQSPADPLKARALLSYVTSPFFCGPGDPRYLHHAKNRRSQKVVRVLNELGYAVDVVHFMDTAFVPRRRRYDLFIGHGGVNFVQIAVRLPGPCVKVYLSTGCYWKFHNEQELARFAALRERRGVELPPDRFIKDSEESALLAADGIIGIGNDFTRKTYAAFSPVIMVNNTAPECHYYEHQSKDYEAGREHFLYFAGPGAVHKGLDLLIEAFAGLEQHLWICAKVDNEFAEVYSGELRNCSNIHLVGWVQPRSSRFFSLMDACNYVILPSCAEGQAQSVIECMNHGLIPVVSQACGLDTGDYGVMIGPCTVENINSVVRTLSTYPTARCREMSMKAHKAALSDFSEGMFSENMKRAVQTVIAEHRIRKEQSRAAGAEHLSPLFVDENHNVLTGRDARTQLQSKSDARYLKQGRGVIEVDVARWEEAQRYEQRSWMEQGLGASEDRNSIHEKAFDSYSAIQGRYFGNAIEVGCGPFTNMIRILRYVRSAEITLLDPLVGDYLTHPNCRYKNSRLGGWLGKKVRTVALPIEDFHTDQVYDLVVVINVLEHCFSVSRFFERIISLTAPGGVLVFHDKLIPASSAQSLVESVYDAGHPLRVVEDLTLGFLAGNYAELYRKHVPVRTPIGEFDSIYFIGRKREGTK